MYSNNPVIASPPLSFRLLKGVEALAEYVFARKSHQVKTTVYQTKGGYYVRTVVLPNGYCKKYYYRKRDEQSGELREFLFSRNAVDQTM